MDKTSNPFGLAGADFDEPPWNYIVALMLFPDDTRKRVEALQAMRAESFKQALQEPVMRELRLPVDVSLAMVEHCSRFREIQEEAAEPLARGAKGVHGPGHGGPVAGLTLLIPLIIWRKDAKRRVSRGHAYKVLAQLIGAGASERTLQSNWMKYRSVAHLWATANLRPDLTCVPGGFSEFIALAQELRSEAGAYVPARDSEPLLPLNVSVSLDLIDPSEKAQTFGPHWIDHIGLPPDFARLMGTD